MEFHQWCVESDRLCKLVSRSALESVTFANNSDTPDVNTRTITWLVNDGDSDSSAITSNVSVASVNDAPLISGVDVAISYTSGQSSVVG